MIQLLSEGDVTPAQLSQLAEQWSLEHNSEAVLALVLTPERLELRKLDEPKQGAVYVDFTSGVMDHRRRFGGGRGEAVAKAIGVKGDYLPTVVDATAGLGRDAFVLAAIGCHVTMFERNPVVAALLADGLERAYKDLEIGTWLKERLLLIHSSSLVALSQQTEKPDVVYLDPMFPHRQKSASVKKEMKVFQLLVGSDDDADDLLLPSRKLAKKRVVVKRPDYAGYLNQQKPSSEIKTKSHRFDLYTVL